MWVTKDKLYAQVLKNITNKFNISMEYLKQNSIYIYKYIENLTFNDLLEMSFDRAKYKEFVDIIEKDVSLKVNAVKFSKFIQLNYPVEISKVFSNVLNKTNSMISSKFKDSLIKETMCAFYESMKTINNDYELNLKDETLKKEIMYAILNIELYINKVYYTYLEEKHVNELKNSEYLLNKVDRIKNVIKSMDDDISLNKSIFIGENNHFSLQKDSQINESKILKKTEYSSIMASILIDIEMGISGRVEKIKHEMEDRIKREKEFEYSNRTISHSNYSGSSGYYQSSRIY